MRRLKQKESLVAEVDNKGGVTIEGKFVGELHGFRFQLDKTTTDQEDKALRSTAIQALKSEFNLRSDRMYNAPDTEFDFTEQGGLMWGEYGVGKLIVGSDILSPKVAVFVDDEISADVAKKIERRLSHFIDRKIAAGFEALITLRDDETVTGLARELASRLTESLGIIPRSVVAKEVKELDQDARGLLRKHGVRFGQYTVFQQLMLKPAPTRLRLVLWSLKENLDEFPEAPPAGLVTIPEVKDAPKGYYPRAGYRLTGERAIRIDMLERLADLIRAENVKTGFEANGDMLSITGTSLEQFANLMQGLGFVAEKGEREKVKSDAALKKEAQESNKEKVEDVLEVFYTFKWVPKQRGLKLAPSTSRKMKGNDKKTLVKKYKPSVPRKEKPIDPDNPFAALMALKGK